MANAPDKRKEDQVKQTRFRTDRMFQDGDSWFFFTREGSIEGPFRSRIEALNQLDLYIKAMTSGLVTPDNDLGLTPR